MTTTSKIVAALALICVSAPAFAHGHGGMGPGGNQPSSYQQNDRSMNHDQTTDKGTPTTISKNIEQSRQQFNKLTPQQQFQVTQHIDTSLRTLINSFATALKAGNEALVKKDLRAIGQLSVTAFKDGFATETNAGSGHDVKIGNLPNGEFTLDGKIVRS